MKYTKSLLQLIVVFLCAFGLLAAMGAADAQDLELNWKHVSHATESHPIVLPETGGYTVGANRGTGLGFFPNNEVASVSFAFTIDYLKGDGTFLAYETYTFPDGSAFTLRRNGRTKSIANSAAAEFTGAFEIINGKGRYASIAEKGEFTGKRVAPLASGADQFFDYRATYKLK